VVGVERSPSRMARQLRFVRESSRRSSYHPTPHSQALKLSHSPMARTTHARTREASLPLRAWREPPQINRRETCFAAQTGIGAAESRALPSRGRAGLVAQGHRSADVRQPSRCLTCEPSASNARCVRPAGRASPTAPLALGQPPIDAWTRAPPTGSAFSPRRRRVPRPFRRSVWRGRRGSRGERHARLPRVLPARRIRRRRRSRAD